MTTKLFITLSTLICSCTSTTKNTDNSDEIQTPKSIQLLDTANSIRGKMLGVWTDGNSDNATLVFYPDSIYYVDSFKWFGYTLNGDTITINYNDYKYVGQVTFAKDTLIMTSGDDKTKLWTFKN